jgi:hypothetical protein
LLGVLGALGGERPRGTLSAQKNGRIHECARYNG